MVGKNFLINIELFSLMETEHMLQDDIIPQLRQLFPNFDNQGRDVGSSKMDHQAHWS